MQDGNSSPSAKPLVDKESSKLKSCESIQVQKESSNIKNTKQVTNGLKGVYR